VKVIEKYLLVFLVILGVFLGLNNRKILAEDYTSQISEITKQIADLEKAMAPLKKESGDLQNKINNAKKQINNMEKQMKDLEKNLLDKAADLEVQKILMAERIKKYYVDSKRFSPMTLFFSNQGTGNLIKQYVWYHSIISRDKTAISQYSQELETLNTNKNDLETQKNKLAIIKKDMESRFGFLSGEIKKAETYKAKLNQELINLEAKRIAELNLPKSAAAGGISCVDDRNKDPGFGSGFAFFTFGIPHHVGLNQYGAFGRANAGQSYDQILRAYYNFDEYQDKSGINIKVNNGNGINQGNIIWTGSLEDYVKRIYEVPASWPIESLKAQAIAARSYALAVTNNGQNSICNNQYCQVFKTDPKGGQWEDAVNQTSGKVMVVGGQPITAWFASTAGGYTFTSGDVWGKNTAWTKRLRDTNGDINSFDDLFAKAYDRESPCFYSAQGYRTEYNKTAWLKPEEVADIVNVVLLYQKDSSIQNHLCYKDNSSGCTNTWGTEKVKSELKNRGGTPFNSINSSSVTDWDKQEGRTNTIYFSGDAGQVSLNGATFKSLFNIRAPANISIVGPLYNVEKR